MLKNLQAQRICIIVANLYYERVDDTLSAKADMLLIS